MTRSGMVEGPVRRIRSPLGPTTTAFGGGPPPRSGEEIQVAICSSFRRHSSGSGTGRRLVRST